jgi:hypothetical protein
MAPFGAIFLFHPYETPRPVGALLTRIVDEQEGSRMLRHDRLRPNSIALTLVAAVTAAGLAGGLAAAQTPPTTIAPTDDAITHPPGTPSSPVSPAPPGSSTQWQLTTAQKSAILTAVRKDSKSASPVNFVVAVGAPVPPSIELYMLPDVAFAEIPVAKLVKYTTVQNQVVLVDPTTMRVVDVIRE